MVELAKNRAQAYKEISASNQTRQERFAKNRYVSKCDELNQQKQINQNQVKQLAEIHARNAELKITVTRLAHQIQLQNDNIRKMLLAIEKAFGKDAMEKYRFFYDRI